MSQQNPLIEYTIFNAKKIKPEGEPCWTDSLYMAKMKVDYMTKETGVKTELYLNGEKIYEKEVK